jgi:hypothetical protein
MSTDIKTLLCVTRMSQTSMLQKTGKVNLQRDIERLSINCADCRYGLCLSRKIYCSLLQERIDNGDILPEYCPYFEPEPSEYKLFRRT